MQRIFVYTGGVTGAEAPVDGVADSPTKRRESALLAGAIHGAAWDGSEGEASPSSKKINQGARN